MFNNKGLTLVETIIYIALVSVFVVATVNFSYHIIRARTKSRTIEEVQQNARFALERIGQEVRKSQSLAGNPLGDDLADDDGNYLLLNQGTEPDEPDNLDDIYFRINSDKQLTIKTGAAGTEIALTNELLQVDELIFTEITNSANQQSVKVDFTVSFTNPNNWPQYNWSTTLEDSLTIRVQ